MRLSEWTARLTIDPCTWLQAHSDQLEPGLILHARPLALAEDLEVPLHGVDPLGRACLVFHRERFDPEFSDQLLEAVCRLRAEPSRYSSLYGAPEAVRVFVVARQLPVQAVQRLKLLAQAFPLRAFELRLPGRSPGGSAGREPDCVLVLPDPAEAAEERLAELDGERAPLARRLLRAARALRPALYVESSGWPWVLSGRGGPCAALHRQDDRLVLAVSDGNGGRVVELDDQDALDRGIDALMRLQYPAVAETGSRARPATP